MSIKIGIKKILAKVPIIDGLLRRFIWSKIHFPEIEMDMLNKLENRSIDIAVDVGAALGCYSWILNRVSNEVFAFEPGNTHYSYLKPLVFCSRINLTQLAIGSEIGKVKLYTPGADTVAYHSATLSESNPVVSGSETSVQEVDQITLDEFFSSQDLAGRSLDLIKIDVEGHELEVIKGSEHIVKSYHPLIICEIEARHNEKYQQVFEMLRDYGYDCYIYRNKSYEEYKANTIEEIQLNADLEIRLSGESHAVDNKYINNFVFQHVKSKIKVYP